MSTFVNFTGNSTGSNTGDVTLAAVGSSPAAEGASLSGQALTLQPADATHPGVWTTGTQTLPGTKTLTGALKLHSGTPYATAALSASEVSLNNGTSDAPGVHFYTAANTCIGIDATSGSGLRFVKNLDESGGAVLASLSTAGTLNLNGDLSCGVITASTAMTSNGTLQCDALWTTTASSLSLRGAAVNGGSAVGVISNNVNALSTSGAKIHSFQNAGVEKAFVDKDGNVEVTTVGAGFILKSPDGTRYKITVANGGALSTTAA